MSPGLNAWLSQRGQTVGARNLGAKILSWDWGHGKGALGGHHHPESYGAEAGKRKADVPEQ